MWCTLQRGAEDAPARSGNGQGLWPQTGSRVSVGACIIAQPRFKRAARDCVRHSCGPGRAANQGLSCTAECGLSLWERAQRARRRCERTRVVLGPAARPAASGAGPGRERSLQAWPCTLAALFLLVWLDARPAVRVTWPVGLATPQHFSWDGVGRGGPAPDLCVGPAGGLLLCPDCAPATRPPLFRRARLAAAHEGGLRTFYWVRWRGGGRARGALWHAGQHQRVPGPMTSQYG